MPRRLRPQVAGIPVHIIKRGNNRQACFYAEADCQFFLHHLGELAMRFRCVLNGRRSPSHPLRRRVATVHRIQQLISCN